MLLRDIHEDIERYLEEDCYCPGEIYDTTGIFFQIFEADEECREIYRGKDIHGVSNDSVISVVCRNQIINFWVNDLVVITAVRYDATENNMKIIPEILKGAVTGSVAVDEFDAGSTKKALDEIFSISDAVIVS